MSVALHDSFVETELQFLRSFAAIVARIGPWAEEEGKSEEDILALRLHPTMLPFAFQVRSIAHHSKDAVEAVLSGAFDPKAGVTPASLAEAAGQLHQATAVLEALDRDRFDACVGRDVDLAIPGNPVPFSAEHFLFSFSLPNFFFHVTTAYDLLRGAGLAIGKRDYLGGLRAKI